MCIIITAMMTPVIFLLRQVFGNQTDGINIAK